MKKTLVFYVTTLAVAGLAIAGVLHLGSSLPPPTPPFGTTLPAPHTTGSTTIVDGLWDNLQHPLSHLFVQLLVIIGVSRAVALVATRIGQPAVVGEMAAGIILGPSLFAALAPGAFAFVFPASSLGTLRLFSQIGVCFFMFAVGMELDAKHVRHRAHVAVAVSHASIVVPYLLGVLLAFFVFTNLAAPGARFTSFALFMGIAMSITAFPVLARILQERNLTRTHLGAMALTCAAVDDVTAWSILAFVVAIANATDVAGATLSLGLVAIFVAVMVLPVRRVLPRLLGRTLVDGQPTSATLALAACIVVAAALTTEVLGIHALFGAFLAGAIMPDRGGFREAMKVRIETFSSVLFLPLFFAFTGLRTEIGLLAGVEGWMICLLIVAVATAGKLGGTAVAARVTGMSWNGALQLGALMNTRGLMELIALNIGYDLGILSPSIFTMLVIMALATTALTGPLLTLLRRRVPADTAVAV